MKYWTSFSADYIEAQLKKLRDNVSTIEMWQDVEDLSSMITGAIIEVGSENTKIRLDEGKYKVAYTHINVQAPIYFHHSKTDMLFKKDIYKIENNIEIVFKTPPEIRFRDLRVTPRFYYKYQDFKNITFQTPSIAQNISTILIDISTAGLSFVVTDKDKKLLNNGQEISIIGLTDQNLPEELKAQIIYIKSFKLDRENNSGLFQIGVQFSSPLDSISYKSISKIVKTKQEKVKGLDTDKFNGLNPEDFLRTISNIAKNDKQLALNIREKAEDIDRLRYLTTDMKRDFLLDVNHDHLACAMRVSTKELIFDLFQDVSSSIREEFLEKLNVPKPPSAILKAQEEITKFITEKERRGEIILDPRSFNKFV